MDRKGTGHLTSHANPVCILWFLLGEVSPNYGICVGGSSEYSSTSRYSASGSNTKNRVSLKCGHVILHILWYGKSATGTEHSPNFGACTGGNGENGASNIFPMHYNECSLDAHD